MFVKNIHFRMRLVAIALIFALSLVIIRVGYIQLFQYERLKGLADQLQSRNLPVEADRGRILDRNGVVLADNLTTTSLVLVPNQIKDKEDTAKKLAEILNVPYEDMLKHVTKKTSMERVHPEGRKLSLEISEKIYNLRIDGVYLMKEALRYYPFDTALSHVLGFVGIDNQGLSGLELYYNEYLTGEAGNIQYFSNAKGNKLNLPDIYNQPVDGMDLVLTIDYQIQLAVERELDNIQSKYNPDHSLAIVADPNTGEILAMSSRPNFSSNDYQGVPAEVYNRNLPVWMTYEPGSTFKVITLASALNEGLVDLDNDHFYDPGYTIVEDARLKCWKAGGHGDQTFLEVVQNSCNPGFVELGTRLGKDRLFSYIRAFGFGEKTGIDLNGEENGIMFKMDRVGPVEAATTAFGQGVSVTPIQQVMAVSAAINGGTLYQPYVAKMFVKKDTQEIVKENKPIITRENIVSKEASAEVRRALENVVAKGTGRGAYIPDYRVGGKTGTAQKAENGRYLVGNYILSFIGMAPADDPQVVVYVSIDNPKNVVQYGGVVAAPVAHNILEDSLTILGVEKREGGIDREYNYFDTKFYEVPAVEGLSVDEAMEHLGAFNVEFSGTGAKILKQTPEAGTYIRGGSTVKLLVVDE